MDREAFLNELLSMTPEEMNEMIIKNGKGPKTIQLICRIQSGPMENNTAST